MRDFYLGILVVATTACLQAGEAADAIFVRRIEPLIHEKCIACHGKDGAKTNSGYEMRNAVGSPVLAGAQNEAAAPLRKQFPITNH